MRAFQLLTCPRQPPSDPTPKDTDRADAKASKPVRKASREIRQRLSRNLKRFREARGYTQEELARRCGFSKNYISNVEQATVNITLANLEALARGLDCTEQDLLSRH